MKVTCNVEKLKNAVTLADRMTGKNMTLPILNAILLIAEGNTIKIRSTNLNVGIELEIPANIEQEGSVVLKGDVVANVCNNISGTTDVVLTLENDNLMMKAQKTTTIIKALPAEEFPILPVVEGEHIEIKRAILEEGIRSVYFAAATTDIKPEIASIYLYSESETLYIVATDSFRLAEKKIVIKGLPDISKILIPYKNINDVLRALEVCGETVRIAYTRNQIAFSGNGVYFTSRLIDGGFPPYQLIIPKEEVTSVVVMKQDLINTLKLSTVFTDKFFQVVFSIDPTQKQFTITSKNSDIGSASSTVDAVIKGDVIEVVCNLKYFLDVFQAVTGDSMSLSFTTPQKPIVIRSVTDTNFLYLLMPTNR
jgi:DNA polymerase-3 subunit beta